MSDIFVCGVGAVSPAGWGMKPFRDAITRNEPLPIKDIPRPGNQPLRGRQVPAASPFPAFLAHPRLRRTSPVAHYAVSAALEALGEDAAMVTNGTRRLGMIYCTLTGCVNYSRRFYDEVLKEPATASPVVFPETVYNSPASHLGALLGTNAFNYTLVGDPGTFLQGLALAADWILHGRVDGCLVVGSEEMDWLTASATRLFDRKSIFSDGAGALYLRREMNQGPPVQLAAVTNPYIFTNTTTRANAMKRARSELNGDSNRALLCDGLQGIPRADRDERAAWSNYSHDRLSIKTLLGEGFMASAALQCVAAVDALARNAYDTANVSVPGTNQQAIAAQFIRRNGSE